jgi:hypothetical protein
MKPFLRAVEAVLQDDGLKCSDQGLPIRRVGDIRHVAARSFGKTRQPEEDEIDILRETYERFLAEFTADVEAAVELLEYCNLPAGSTTLADRRATNGLPSRCRGPFTGGSDHTRRRSTC